MNRGSFLTASASLAALVPGGTQLVERKADFDEAAFARIVGRPADIRQLWEAVAFHPAMFNNVKNALNGLQFGFGYPANRISLAICGHGPSSVYTYASP
ncbi:MAG: hypothetical protein ACREP1_02920, partial [Rhodanobacteraceae bacterium]